MAARKLKKVRTRPTQTAARWRLRSGSGNRTTLGPGWETRLIVVAQGIEFHNTDLPDGKDPISGAAFIDPKTGQVDNWRIPDCLWDDPLNVRPDLKIPGLVRHSSTRATYTNDAQKVRYTIQVITDKQEFHEYLENRRGTATYGNNILVMYNGHARYGRGPCLGATDAPGEHWGTGNVPTVEGIFRMGYPYLHVACTEILYHQYHATVARQATSDPDLPAVNLRRLNRRTHIHPHLRKHLKFPRRTKGYSMAELDKMVQDFQNEVTNAKAMHPILSAVSHTNINKHTYLYKILNNINHTPPRNSLRPYIFGQKDANERFWATWIDKEFKSSYWDGTAWRDVTLVNPNRRNGKFRWPQIILYAHWRDTLSGKWSVTPFDPPARMDLGATNMNCRGFCHFGCSTHVHNYPVMRRMKKWQRSKGRNNRLCYWTTKSAHMNIGPYWLYHMLTYIPGYWEGFRTRNWGDVCRYARNRTNADLSLVPSCKWRIT